jgi:hypothetical protein
MKNKRVYNKLKLDGSKGMYFDILVKEVGKVRAEQLIKYARDPLANFYTKKTNENR